MVPSVPFLPLLTMPLVQGQTALVTLPSNLAPGNYIIRHEIIALQLAQSEGGAEFYPSCTQLKVGGDQTGAPEPDELVLLPGAYKDTDPGIWDQDVCYNFSSVPCSWTIVGLRPG